MSKSNADTLRDKLSKMAATMMHLTKVGGRVTLPDHKDRPALEAEFAKRAMLVHKHLMWMDDRLTEKIIYASKEVQK